MQEHTWHPIGIDRDGARCTVYFARRATGGGWEFTHEQIGVRPDRDRVHPTQASQ